MSQLIWNADGPAPRGLRELLVLIFQNIFELICLNLFFLVCCIPLITAPFAVSALVRVMLDICRGKGSHPLWSYWRTFVHFERRIYLAGLPPLLLSGLLGWGLLIYLETKTDLWLFWIGCGINLTAYILMYLMMFYLFPLLHDTRERAPRVWRTAFFLAVAHLPHSMVAFAAIAVLWGLCLRHFQSAWIAAVLLLVSLSCLIGTYCAAGPVGEYADSTAERGGEPPCIS